MAVNNYRPHILVLPEDDANRQIANGFVNGVDNRRQIQVLPIANGWIRAKDLLSEVHVKELRTKAERFLVLLVDFDNREDRAQEILKVVPADLQSRVLVLGSWEEAEDLTREELGRFEGIGEQLAYWCRERGLDDDDIGNPWQHRLLKHNLVRLRGASFWSFLWEQS